MKKSISYFALLSLLTLGACRDDSPVSSSSTITKIQLSETADITLKTGFSKDIILSGGNGKDYSVSHSVPDIVETSVKDKTLTIKGKGKGKVTLTITSGSEKTTLVVNVEESVASPIPVQKIELKQTKYLAGREQVLNAEIFPKNATNQEIIWELDPHYKNDVTLIDPKKGIFKFGANKLGYVAEFTAKALDGSGVVGKFKVESIQLIKNIKINYGSELKLQVGATAKLEVEFTPSEHIDKNIIWKSSHKEVATVDADGNIKALAEGKTTITAETTDGSTESEEIEITVMQKPVNKIVLDQATPHKTLTIKNKEKIPLTISTFLDDEKIETITKGKPKSKYAKLEFSVEKPSESYIAQVEDGVLSANKTGTFDLRISYKHDFEAEAVDTIIKVTVVLP